MKIGGMTALFSVCPPPSPGPGTQKELDKYLLNELMNDTKVQLDLCAMLPLIYITFQGMFQKLFFC